MKSTNFIARSVALGLLSSAGLTQTGCFDGDFYESALLGLAGATDIANAYYGGSTDPTVTRSTMASGVPSASPQR